MNQAQNKISCRLKNPSLDTIPFKERTDKDIAHFIKAVEISHLNIHNAVYSKNTATLSVASMQRTPRILHK
ncbi:hypothetical protein APHWI1_0370 [Anaplasma phagocytophilum str. ApWI1]|uniref:Uncharacterized protein n=1 Tax=Anaplasma phagocytophilum str. ApWI1 TaxID=1359155 RepID=A0A0F3PWX1_ANAPH|nr:hypothetical protein APHWI1_0370 [Anaplasma phagocytophilum str. ApWI1]